MQFYDATTYSICNDSLLDYIGQTPLLKTPKKTPKKRKAFNDDGGGECH